MTKNKTPISLYISMGLFIFLLGILPPIIFANLYWYGILYESKIINYFIFQIFWVFVIGIIYLVLGDKEGVKNNENKIN